MRKLISIGLSQVPHMAAPRIGLSQVPHMAAPRIDLSQVPRMAAPRMEARIEAQDLTLLLPPFLGIINQQQAKLSRRVTDLLLILLNTTTGLLGVMLTLIQASKGQLPLNGEFPIISCFGVGNHTENIPSMHPPVCPRGIFFRATTAPAPTKPATKPPSSLTTESDHGKSIIATLTPTTSPNPP